MSLWPNLKLPAPHPQLDWVEPHYTAESVTQLADAMRDNPHPIQTRTAAGVAGVWDPTIEALLRAVAGNDKALAALNHDTTRSRGDVLRLNRAAHFHVLQAATPEKVSVLHMLVADAWGCSAGHVKDACSEEPDAKRIVEHLTHNVGVAQRLARDEVLHAFAADMAYRAAQYQQRKKTTE